MADNTNFLLIPLLVLISFFLFLHSFLSFLHILFAIFDVFRILFITILDFLLVGSLELLILSSLFLTQADFCFDCDLLQFSFLAFFWRVV